MLFRGRRYVTTAFVSVLQQLFRTHNIYTWNKNRLTTKIYIDESYPDGERKYPCIIVHDETEGNFFSSSFNRHFQEEVYDAEHNFLGFRHGYGNDVSTSINISALTKYEAEILSDIVCSFLVFYGEEKFRSAGIILKEGNSPSLSTEQYGKNDIYTISITMTSYVEYEKLYTPKDIQKVEEIKIPYLDVIYKDGETGTQEKVQRYYIDSEPPEESEENTPETSSDEP